MSSRNAVRRTLTSLGAIAVILGLLAGPAAALVVTPTRTDDPTSGGDSCVTPPLDCSLRNAVKAALGGGTVDLRGGPATYDITQEALPITDSLSLLGAGARQTILRRTAGVGSLLYIGQTPSWMWDGTDSRDHLDAVVSGLTITGGNGQPTVSGGGGQAGGIDIQHAHRVLLTGLHVTGNASGPLGAYGQGVAGGIFVFESETAIVNSDITDNTSSSGSFVGIAGGIYHAGGTLELINTTVAGNTAEWGGGIYQAIGYGPGGNNFTNRVVLDNATIVDNTATGRAGNIDMFDGTLEARNSIVADGHGPHGPSNCGGEALPEHSISHGYNLEGQTTECNFTAQGDMQGVTSSELTPLGDHGGPTDTTVPTSASLAIDGGDPAGCQASTGDLLTTDQRDLTRPVGGRCDIGAVEASATRGEYTGCQVLGAVRPAAQAITSTIGCGSNQTVTEIASVYIAPAAQSRSLERSAGGKTYHAGHLVRLVRRHKRAHLRLRLSHRLASEIHAARGAGRHVHVRLRLSAHPRHH